MSDECGPDCKHTFHVEFKSVRVEQIYDDEGNRLADENKITISKDGFSTTIERPSGWIESSDSTAQDPIES